MYRTLPRPCAACGSPVRQMSFTTSLGDCATVEVCLECGGVFLDYNDGEPSTVARALDRKLAGQLHPKRRRHYDPTCSNCDQTMELLEYLHDGPPLFRCSACMAVFATPAQRQAVAKYAHWAPPPSVLRRIWNAFFA